MENAEKMLIEADTLLSDALICLQSLSPWLKNYVKFSSETTTPHFTDVEPVLSLGVISKGRIWEKPGRPQQLPAHGSSVGGETEKSFKLHL